MKLAFSASLLFLLFLFACSDSKQQEQNNAQKQEKKPVPVEQEAPKEEVIELPAPEPNDADYAQLDSAIKEDILTLDNAFGSTPFYTILDGRNYYITCSGAYNYNLERFGGILKYGLANDSLTEILPATYDKIYNPNLTLKNCFEIARGTKVGLVNYLTGEVLQPQFDYILPGGKQPGEVAFGLQNGNWYKIESHQITVPQQTEFDPVPVFKNLSFNIQKVGNSLMFDSYWQEYENDPLIGRGVVIPPSYVAYLGLLEIIYTDIILSDQQERADFGTEEARLRTVYKRSLSDKVKAFFVSIYESGIDARGYETEARQLIIHHAETNTTNSIQLGSLNDNDYFCREAGYRFVNDSIIEIKANNPKYQNESQRYEFETSFTYHKVESDGKVVALTSNRYYDCTKFIFMDESHLKGCFATSIEEARYPNDNMWMADHLSIEDLDIMRNEIFAEYGYKFKTEKWQKYFSQQLWYEPRYDDVNDQLTEIDKANIKLILTIKERMKDNEESYLNKRTATYYRAG